METIPSCIVFVVWLVGDIVWAKYAIGMAKLHKWMAPIWAALITGFTMFNVDMFSKSLWYGVPAILGAVIGTHLTIRYEIWAHKRKAQKLAYRENRLRAELLSRQDEGFMRVVWKNPRYIESE